MKEYIRRKDTSLPGSIHIGTRVEPDALGNERSGKE